MAPIILREQGRRWDIMNEEEKSVKATLPIGKQLDHRSNVKKEPLKFEDLPPEVRSVLVHKKTEDAPDSRTTIQKLEGKHVLSLIVYLNSVSPVTKTDIYSNVARHGNMISKIQDLYEMGLINIYETGRTDSNIIIISEKGRSVAEKVMRIIDIIEEDDYR